jgi:tetratricopeptide (TPR) repeat protein
MPSLSALQKFRASFSDIGREKTDLEGRGIPYAELDLPETEALSEEPETPQRASDTESATADSSAPDTGTGLTEPEQTPDDFDFSSFLDTVPDSFGGDSAEQTPDSGAPQSETQDDFSIPDDLLSGFSDEHGPGSFDSEPPPDLGTESNDLGAEPLDLGGESLDLGAESNDLGSEPLDLGGESPDLGTEPNDLGSEPLDLGGESLDLGSESLDLGGEPLDLGTEPLDLGGESPDLGAESSDLGGESLDLGGEPLDLGTEPLDLGGESPDLGAESSDLGGELPDLGGEPLDLGGESLDLGGESGDLGGESLDLGGESGDLGGEPLDLGGEPFDLGGEPLDLGGESSDSGGESYSDEAEAELLPVDNIDESLDMDSGHGGSADTDDTDFTLPGFDDLFDGAPPGTTAKKSASVKQKAVRKKEDKDDVEEIRLNDEELDRFNRTLSGYPLNLRIACGEIIVEQAVAPALMSQLIKMLINGAPAKETAALAGKILNRTIPIPRGFQKSTGEAMEAEQASFAYIFVHKFLPMFRLFAIIGVLVFCLCYLTYKFIYTPIHAENLYKIGYERIFAGEYQRANERFDEAFQWHRKKVWFYRYAEAFRDERQYFYAEQKYDDLLRFYPRDKKGVLDYAALETYNLRNFEKADRLLRRELLDYAPDDPDGLLALGDNSLAWGEIDSSKYEDARFAYARLLDLYGWKDPVIERMMKYFIRTDNLKEVLPLYDYFTNNKKRKISADSLAELGGYLLDKQLEEQRGVPNEYIERIEGIRPLLLRAVAADPSLPESHYHLSRYYHNLGNSHEERITLETAIKAFDDAAQESMRRLNYRIDAQLRYANILINSREFFAAEESLAKGSYLYEDALARRLITRSPEFGKLYAGLGDLEYFAKSGDWEQALIYYHRAEQNGWSPPEVQYRMGRAYYQQENWKDALEYFFMASANLPLNRRLLFALGNASYQRGDYFASQGYFNRLLDMLETERSRLPVLLPNDRPEYQELAERLMMARNNAGAVYEALAERTGGQSYRSRAMGLYAEASRAWDSLTRNPQTMIRSGSVPLPQLNARNTLYPQTNYEPQIFLPIDPDVLEPSQWELLVAPGSF